MRTTFFLGVAGLALIGCAVTDDIVEQTSRDVAKGVVNSVVQQRFPGLDAAPYTDCIIDNASVDEIFSLAQSALVGSGDRAATLVLDIAKRPAASRCIAENALFSVLG